MNNNSDTDHLDLSWTEQYIRTTESQTIYNKEPMSKINIQFIYVNTRSEICNTITESYPLKLNGGHDGSSILSEQIIIPLTKSKGVITGSNGLLMRYQLDDILLYCVTLDPTNLFDYINKPNDRLVDDGSSFMKKMSIIDDIVIPPSLFIFHPLNTIYFIFREMVLVQDVISRKTTLKSAIMTKTGANKATKRVRIANDLPKYRGQDTDNNHNKTAKIRILL